VNTSLPSHRTCRLALAVICALVFGGSARPAAAQEIDGGEILTWALIGGAVGAVIGLVAVLAAPADEDEESEASATTQARPAAAAAPRDTELLSASASLDGVTVRWLGRPRRDASAVQMRFQRYARSAGGWGCGELQVVVDGETTRHPASYRTSSQNGVNLEVLDSEVRIEQVRAMRTAQRVEFHLCGVDRTLTVSGVDAIRKFLAGFDAVAPATARRAASAAFFGQPRVRDAAAREVALGRRWAEGVSVTW